jgi:hypothetical protein
MPPFGRKTLLQSGDLRFSHGEREFPCTWALYSDRSLAVNVRGTNSIMVKRVLDVAVGADLNRLVREAAKGLVAGS